MYVFTLNIFKVLRTCAYNIFKWHVYIIFSNDIRNWGIKILTGTCEIHLHEPLTSCRTSNMFRSFWLNRFWNFLFFGCLKLLTMLCPLYVYVLFISCLLFQFFLLITSVASYYMYVWVHFEYFLRVENIPEWCFGVAHQLDVI